MPRRARKLNAHNTAKLRVRYQKTRPRHIGRDWTSFGDKEPPEHVVAEIEAAKLECRMKELGHLRVCERTDG